MSAEQKRVIFVCQRGVTARLKQFLKSVNQSAEATDFDDQTITQGYQGVYVDFLSKQEAEFLAQSVQNNTQLMSAAKVCFQTQQQAETNGSNFKLFKVIKTEGRFVRGEHTQPLKYEVRQPDYWVNKSIQTAPIVEKYSPERRTRVSKMQKFLEHQKAQVGRTSFSVKMLISSMNPEEFKNMLSTPQKRAQKFSQLVKFAMFAGYDCSDYELLEQLERYGFYPSKYQIFALGSLHFMLIKGDFYTGEKTTVGEIVVNGKSIFATFSKYELLKFVKVVFDQGSEGIRQASLFLNTATQ